MAEDGETIDLIEVKTFLREFAADRDWEQFHTPKNLAMALAAEAGELLEIFQWLTPEESDQVGSDEELQRATEDELADIVQYAIRMSDVLGINLNDALWRKLRENSTRYPAALSKGNATKYPDLTKDDTT